MSPLETEPITVLHVDDEPEFVELTATYLERQDDRFEVETATDAAAGLDRLAERPFDCVVSDYEMPGQDGLAFLEAVRAADPDLPFILFTGKGSEAVASEAISSGVTDYLQKEPGASQYEILANRIENAVAQRRARAAAADSERRLRTLADNTKDILWMYTADWQELLFINAAYEDIWGRSIEELRDYPPSFQRGVHPDDRPIVREAMDRLSGGDPIDLEFRVNAAEDYRRWVWVQGQPIRDADGDVAKVVGFARDVTDRKAREERLQLMEQLVNTMNDGAVLTQDGVIEYVNPQVTALTGHDAADLVGRPMTEFIAPGDRETVAERHRARLDDQADGPPAVYEIEVVTADGDTRPVEISVSRIDYDGDPATLSLVRDITDRKRRERELHRLNEEYETVFETAQDGIFLVDVLGEGDDPDFEFRRLNPAHEAISGLSTEGVRGKTPREVLGDDLGAQVAAHYRRCVEAEEPIAYTEVLEMPAKTVHWRTTLGPVLTDGEVTQIVGVARDVSERRARERELERFESMVEASGDPMYTVDADGHFTFVNDAFLELVGYDEAALLGAHASKVLDEADVERGEQLVRSLLAGERDRGTHELSVATADGERVPCEAQMTLLPADDGFRGTVGVLRDISDRVERERRLERERDRMEEFASIVSHDLRGPLNVATGQLALARERVDNDHLAAVADAHDRMESLIDDLLTLAREGRPVDDPEPVELAELADRCWESVATDGASLAVETDRTVRADPASVRQLLENLFRNAVHHADEGVGVTVGDHPDGFYVADDGPGIPADARDRVFDAGYTTADDGTGIGLSIVTEIAEAHGWDVALAQGADGGARFEIACDPAGE